MFSLDTLDVAIGVVFVFLSMSLIASALRELLEAFLKTRAQQLELGIVELLRESVQQNTPAAPIPQAQAPALQAGAAPAAAPNPQGADAPPPAAPTGILTPVKTFFRLAKSDPPDDLVTRFYNHPAISSLYVGTYEAGSKALPSYIPSKAFSLAILDLAGQAASGEVLSIESLQASVTTEPDNPAKRMVRIALAAANDDLHKLRHTLEQWFDGAMERVGGWYTRTTTYVLFVLGLLAAIVFNVDAITVAKHLKDTPQLRDAAIVQAENVVATPPQAKQPDPPEPNPKPVDLDQTFKHNIKIINDLRATLEDAGFPIGWVWSETGKVFPYPGPQMCKADGVFDDKSIKYACTPDVSTWLSTLIGWFITAVAITLGAPFWFDVLSKLMVVRSTLKPKDSGTAPSS